MSGFFPRWIMPFFMVATGLPMVCAAQQTIFVVRHGEKSVESKNPKDPALSVQGMARAERLAQLLSAANIKTIYVSEYQRTAMQAAPLAKRLGITPIAMPAADITALIKRMAEHNLNEAVLVVGHSNTVPMILKGLGATEDVKLGEDEYDDLFIVVPPPIPPPTPTPAPTPTTTPRQSGAASGAPNAPSVTRLKY